MAETPETNKPDFTNGFPIRDLADETMMSGQAGGEELVLARRGDEVFAIATHCTHYGGPLAEGLIVGDTLRCPWHHACFSLRTGEALRAPALDPVSCWRVERVGDKIFVREKLSPPAPKRGTDGPSSVVIVGGGAAGLAAADMLRREGYDGPLTIVSADDCPPVDRPNLSKDYLAGTAQEDWIPLRPSDFYRDRNIDLLLNSRVSSLDTKKGRYCSRMGGRSTLAHYCWPPAPIPSIWRFKVQLIRRSIICARSMTAKRSLPGRLRQNVWWFVAFFFSGAMKQDVAFTP